MITVFTSITGGKDKPREMLEIKKQSKAKFVAFLDTPYVSSTWDIKPSYTRLSDPRRNSRAPKILAHQFVSDDFSIYIDGNISLLTTPEKLIEKYLVEPGYDMAVFKHPTRDCIYDEAIQCAKRGLDDPEIIIEQAKAYEDAGYGKHKGLCECGIIFRRHTPQVATFNHEWWAQYSRYSKRDQISFMYAVDQIGLPVNMVADFFQSRITTIDKRRVEIGVRDGLFDIIPHKTNV